MSIRIRSLVQPVARSRWRFAVAAILIVCTCGEPFPRSLSVVGVAYSALFRGAFGDANGVLRSLAKATPLLFSGLAVTVALRSGLFQHWGGGAAIGGGLAAGWAGYAIRGLPIFVHLPMALVAGAAAGAALGVHSGGAERRGAALMKSS